MVKVTDTSNTRLKDSKSGLLDSSDDEDDVPLVNLLKKTKDKKQLLSLDSSDDEDDVPLVNLLKKTKDQKQCEQTADSSDEELLSLVAKSAPAKKASANQNRSRSIHVGKRTAALDSSDDEDDVPLVNLLKKIKDQKQSKRTAGQTLSSEAPQTQHDDDSSDDEPLSTFKKTGPSKKEAANQIALKSSHRTYQRTESSDGSSDDDDVPLVNLIRKKNQSTTKTKTRSTPAQRSTSKPTTRAPRMHAESSDDEPLINLLKKSLKDTTNTTLPQGNGKRPRKRGESPWNNNQGPSGKTAVTKRKKKRQRAGNNGLSSDSSDDEPLVKITKVPQEVNTKGPQLTTKGPQVNTKGPQVTMLLKVMVERCRV